jgi:hypothetical protein
MPSKFKAQPSVASAEVERVLEAELERVRAQIDELGAYADSLRSFLNQAKGSSNGAKSEPTRRKPRKRAPSDSKPKRLDPAKLDALREYLRTTIGTGGVFASPDVGGWQGFQALGISKSGLALGLRELVQQGHLAEASRAEHPSPANLGPRANVYRVTEAPAPAPS